MTNLIFQILIIVLPAFHPNLDGRWQAVSADGHDGIERGRALGEARVGDENILIGKPLDLDHGVPARMIAPGRPGVLQTKWLSKLEVI